MKKLITIAFLLLADYALWAQTPCDDFRAYLYNKEYGVFLKIDLCDESITIPDQDFYGSLPGYMGKKVNNFIWLITSAEVKEKSAKLTMINEFGSEDLIASLVRENDSLYMSAETVAERKMAEDAQEDGVHPSEGIINSHHSRPRCRSTHRNRHHRAATHLPWDPLPGRPWACPPSQ